MPAKPVSINLLNRDDFENTPQGRIVAWALTYGRYIMIGTEIVVLLAFISRFSLDRKLTDLKDEIEQKQAILQANLPLENEIRDTQDRIAKIRELVTDQRKSIDTFELITSLLPPDLIFKTVDIAKDRMSADVIAGTTSGFSTFLNNLQASQKVQLVEIQDIKRDQLTGIRFKFSVQLVQAKK